MPSSPESQAASSNRSPWQPLGRTWKILSTFVTLVLVITLWVVNSDAYLTMPPLLAAKGLRDFKQQDQKRHIQHVCELIANGTYNVPRTYDKTLSHQEGIVDHFHQTLYCDIKKAGTSSWFALYSQLVEREKRERSHWFKKHPYTWYKMRDPDRWKTLRDLGINRISRGTDAHREVKDDLPDPRREYFKFMQVRHPLDRLASAYFSRVYGKDGRDDIKDIKKTIRKINKGKKSDDSSEISFLEYLTYVALPDDVMTHDVCDHWKTYQSVCEPCSMQYDYVAHLETLASDLNDLLPRMNAMDFVDSFPEANIGAAGSQKYRNMYQNVPYGVLQPVLDKYKADADMFGYTFDDYINVPVK